MCITGFASFYRDLEGRGQVRVVYALYTPSGYIRVIARDSPCNNHKTGNITMWDNVDVSFSSRKLALLIIIPQLHRADVNWQVTFKYAVILSLILIIR